MLSAITSPERVARINAAVEGRTFNVLPIIEGVYDMGNLAAVARSADAFGIGALHLINNSNGAYKQSARHSAGAHKWLDFRMWIDTAECMAAAKAAGFQIVATHMRADSVDAQDVDWSRPTAIVLGNEHAGVSQAVVDAADVCAVIPMAGMVESLNVSVAGALMMHEARRGRQRLLGRHGDLTPQQQDTLRAVMLLRHSGKTGQILEAMLERPWQPWQQYTVDPPRR